MSPEGHITYLSELIPHLFSIQEMYYVYVLKTKKDNSLYVGYTNDVERRVGEHNNSKVGYTKGSKPWNLIYYESFVSLEDAKQREKNLKYFGKAFGQLKRRIKNSLNK